MAPRRVGNSPRSRSPQFLCRSVCTRADPAYKAELARREEGSEAIAGGPDGLEVFCVPSYPAQLVEEPFVRDLAIKLRSCISESTARENSIADTDCASSQSDFEQLAASLKRCPDTKREFFSKTVEG